jgi:hypothetical protein
MIPILDEKKNDDRKECPHCQIWACSECPQAVLVLEYGLQQKEKNTARLDEIRFNIGYAQLHFDGQVGQHDFTCTGLQQQHPDMHQFKHFPENVEGSRGYLDSKTEKLLKACNTKLTNWKPYYAYGYRDSVFAGKRKRTAAWCEQCYFTWVSLQPRSYRLQFDTGSMKLRASYLEPLVIPGDDKEKPIVTSVVPRLHGSYPRMILKKIKKLNKDALYNSAAHPMPLDLCTHTKFLRQCRKYERFFHSNRANACFRLQTEQSLCKPWIQDLALMETWVMASLVTIPLYCFIMAIVLLLSLSFACTLQFSLFYVHFKQGKLVILQYWKKIKTFFVTPEKELDLTKPQKLSAKPAAKNTGDNQKTADMKSSATGLEKVEEEPVPISDIRLIGGHMYWMPPQAHFDYLPFLDGAAFEEAGALNGLMTPSHMDNKEEYLSCPRALQARYLINKLTLLKCNLPESPRIERMIKSRVNEVWCNELFWRLEALGLHYLSQIDASDNAWNNRIYDDDDEQVSTRAL